MKTLAADYPVKQVATALEISRAGYYRTDENSPRSVEDAQLTVEITKIYKAHKKRYGSPRVHIALKEKGIHCGENRVAKLMRRAGLRGICPRRKAPRTTDSKHGGPIAPNLLKEMEVTGPNEAWAMDITYVKVGGSWAYLAAVLDHYLHQIVGWDLAPSLHASSACTALKRAMIRQGHPKGVVIHSDRGCQYASDEFMKVSKKYNCARSMSAKGNCYDNATMESFFGVIKREELDQMSFDNIDQLRAQIFEYIETYYNRNRIHSTLGMSPAAFERIHYTAAPAAEFSEAWVDPMVEKKAGENTPQPRPKVSTSDYPAAGCSPAEPSSVSPDTPSIQHNPLEIKH